MNPENQKVVTRFAPSPTGFMHIGGIRTAIFAYLWARKNNGTFILRIEDTDKEREVPGSIEHIQKSLKWIGIDWDYGPGMDNPFGSAIQSERLSTYIEYAHKLIEKGLAYPDPYTAEEVDVFRKKAEEEKRAFLYRDHRPETFGVWDGKQPLRFKVPEIKRYKWQDVVRGELEAGEEALDDFILIKSDGYPTYNFAHIIDDFNMGVTHIIRGEEFISSTPRFLSLYDALGFTYPVFVSAPQILRDDRTKKLGKRDGAKDILDYKKEGYLPETMFNFLALIGWNPGGEKEVFSQEELISIFELERIQKGGAVFNEEKLDWMNKEHIKKLSADEQFEKVLEYMPEEAKKLPQYSEVMLKKIMSLVIERIEKWSDVTTLFDYRFVVERNGDLMCPVSYVGEFSYFFTPPTLTKDVLYWKDDRDAEVTKERLSQVLELISNADESKFADAETTKTLIWDYANTEGRGQVLWPTRVALSGREKSPDPFTLLSLLGKEESISRIQKAIEILD